MKIIEALKEIANEINLEIEKEKLKNKKTYTKKNKDNGKNNKVLNKASAFEQKYGKREYFKNSIYSYGDEEESELSDTVPDYTNYLQNFKSIKIENSKKENPLSKELKKRNSARKSFIHSIIFERKI